MSLLFIFHFIFYSVGDIKAVELAAVGGCAVDADDFVWAVVYLKVAFFVVKVWCDGMTEDDGFVALIIDVKFVSNPNQCMSVGFFDCFVWIKAGMDENVVICFIIVLEFFNKSDVICKLFRFWETIVFYVVTL